MGSEMCIRDRHSAAGGGPEERLARDRRGGLEGALRSGVQGEDERCLLYTSDAADDPLCVDLGGRRNIKKKKNTNN